MCEIDGEKTLLATDYTQGGTIIGSNNLKLKQILPEDIKEINGSLNPQDYGALFVKFILENQDVTISYTLKRASDLSNAAQAPFLESLKNYVWAFYYGAF